MSFRYLPFLGLYLVGLAIRALYEHRKKLEPAFRERKIPFLVVLVAMLGMWAGWFGMSPLDPLRLTPPAFARWTGLGAVGAGTILSVGALLQLRGVEHIDHLVTTGLFARIRHPMYLGFVLWVLGWATCHGAVLSLCFGLLAIGNILYWRRLEEASLGTGYGAAYQAYRERTWF